jgi:hypothetical protein
MPKPKAVETAVKGADTIMLRMGKANNVIQWKEDMNSLATEEFGEVGTYVAYHYPFPHEREYNPFYVEPIVEAAAVVNEDEGDNEVEDAEVEEDLGEVVQLEAVPLPDIPEAARVVIIRKLREGAFEARRKSQEAALLGLYMRLDKTMSEYLVRINPKYTEFRQTNGTITVLLKKALYGCVESASLWYGNLGQTLKGLG